MVSLVPDGAPGSIDFGRHGALVQPSCATPHAKGAWLKNLKLTLQGAVLIDLKEPNLHLVLPTSGRSDSVTIVSLDAVAVGGYRVSDKRIDTLHKSFAIALRGQAHLPKSPGEVLSSREAPKVYIKGDDLPWRIHSLDNDARSIALQPIISAGSQKSMLWKDFLEGIDMSRTTHEGSAYIPTPMACEYIIPDLLPPDMPYLADMPDLPAPVPPPPPAPAPLPPPPSGSLPSAAMPPPPSPLAHISQSVNSVTGKEWIIDLSSSIYDPLFVALLKHSSLQDDLSAPSPTRAPTKRQSVLFSRLAPTLGMCDEGLRIDNLAVVVNAWSAPDINRYLQTALARARRIDPALVRQAVSDFPRGSDRKRFEQRWQQLQHEVTARQGAISSPHFAGSASRTRPERDRGPPPPPLLRAPP